MKTSSFQTMQIPMPRWPYTLFLKCIRCGAGSNYFIFQLSTVATISVSTTSWNLCNLYCNSHVTDLWKNPTSISTFTLSNTVRKITGHFLFVTKLYPVWYGIQRLPRVFERRWGLLRNVQRQSSATDVRDQIQFHTLTLQSSVIYVPIY